MSGPDVLVSLESARLAHGSRVLLDGVSLGVAVGERIGVVGRNGVGKTTLLEVLAGRTVPDGGRVARAGGLRAVMLAQADVLDPRASVRRAVVGDQAEHEWRSDPRVRGVVDHLLAGIGLDVPVGPLSGGERRRVALAAVLVSDPDLLLLDEPTNHLDVEGVDWLARHLAARRGALVAVTHDRWFLDAVAERTWEVVDGRVDAYDGGYAAYVLARAERERSAAVRESRRQNLLRKELAWLRRGAPARTSKPRFRLDAAAALVADEPPPRDQVQLLRAASARLGRSVFDVEDVDLTLGGRALLRQVTWRLGPGDRVGVVGINGAGKSSLLRLLAGDLAPDAGQVRTGRTVRAGLLPQEAGVVDPDLRALEAVEEVRPVVELGSGGGEVTARQLAERFGLVGERLWTRVGDLSGGERRRVQLLRLLASAPNVLLLDEPTNDLDVETLTALEDALDGFAGTLVVVSHDRYFVERVCDRVVGLLGDGGLRDLPGGVEEYLERRRRTEQEQSAAAPLVARPAAGPRSAAAAREARKELGRIERRLARLGVRAGELHEQLAGHATDPDAVLRLDAELRRVDEETARLEEQWLEVAGSLEAG